MRRNDNDSIGDDDRRGVGGPAHRYNGSNPFVRQKRFHGQQQNTATPEPPFAVLPTAVHCSRADVITHFKSNDKAEEGKRVYQETGTSQVVGNLEIKNPLA